MMTNKKKLTLQKGGLWMAVPVSNDIWKIKGKFYGRKC